MDDGRSQDVEKAVCKNTKVGASTTEIVPLMAAATSSAGGTAVVPVPLDIRNVGMDVGEIVNQIMKMQQLQLENQMRMQQTLLEQVVRLLPVGGGQVDPGVRQSGTIGAGVRQDLPVAAYCAPTQVDASGLAAEQWEHAVLKPPVVEAKELQSSASRHYTKVARKFEENIVKFQKSERNMKQVRADIIEMREGGDRFRYPTGTRPWTSPGDAVQLDQPWLPTVEGDFVVGVTVPRGSTRREVLQRLHHCHELTRKDVHAEALLDHVTFMRPLTTRSAFFRACADFKDAELEALDLEHGRQVTANGKLALKKCEDLYTAIIDKIRKKKMFEKRSEEETAKLEAEKEERLKAIDPKAALKGLVNEAVRQAVGVVKMEEDSEMGFNPAQASDYDHAGDIIAVLQPKNGLSPGGPWGPTTNQKARAKAKRTRIRTKARATANGKCKSKEKRHLPKVRAKAKEKAKAKKILDKSGRYGNLPKKLTSTRSMRLFQTKVEIFGKGVGQTAGLNGHGANKTSGLRERVKLVAKEKAAFGEMESRRED